MTYEWVVNCDYESFGKEIVILSRYFSSISKWNGNKNLNRGYRTLFMMTDEKKKKYQ